MERVYIFMLWFQITLPWNSIYSISAQEILNFQHIFIDPIFQFHVLPNWQGKKEKNNIAQHLLDQLCKRSVNNQIETIL